MDFEQGLLTRRSNRRFVKNRTIPPKDMEEILKIAMHSPSARNSQCWEFIVVDDKSKFTRIAELHPYASFIKDASAAIFVCGNMNEQMDKDYWVVDTAAATMSLLYACHAKELGSCWCGIYPDAERVKKFSNFLGTPPYIQPLAMVIIGYKAEETVQPQNRYHINKIHHNHW